MTTKPTVVCPTCHETIDLEHGGRCSKCGTELRAAEQPGVATPGPEKPASPPGTPAADER